MASGGGQYSPGDFSAKPADGQKKTPNNPPTNPPVDNTIGLRGFIKGLITGAASLVIADAAKDHFSSPHVQNPVAKDRIDEDGIEVPNIYGDTTKGTGGVYIYRDSKGFKKILDITISPDTTTVHYNNGTVKSFKNYDPNNLELHLVGEGKDTDKPIRIHLVNERDDWNWKVTLPNEKPDGFGGKIESSGIDSTGNKIVFDVSGLKGNTTIENRSANTLVIDGLSGLDREKLRSERKKKELETTPKSGNDTILFDSKLIVISDKNSLTGFRTEEKEKNGWMPEDYITANTNYNLIGQGYLDSLNLRGKEAERTR